jgi:ACS family glucarate transporter-like MFS transporter
MTTPTVLEYASQTPTRVRYRIIGAAAFAAMLMYLDRMCMSQMVNSASFQHDLGFGPGAVGAILATFFLAYALAQMPAAWLGDRFGARPLLSCLIAIWSFFTILTGFATGYWSLMFARVGCGIAEAGAYPASSALVARWIPLRRRGLANGIVAGGGRLGGAMAPWITAMAIVGFSSWRVPGWIYGAVGIVFAGVFWVVCRNKPSEHPAANRAEKELIEQDSAAASADIAERKVGIPWAALLRSRDMWLMCLYLYLTNVGWAFLATHMPTFLKESKGLSESAAGRMSTYALLAGMTGMLAGGWITDALTRRFGLRQGRMIPLAWSRFIGAGAYLLCLGTSSPWTCVVAFAMVAIMTDVSMPATWGYTQDVGGRNLTAAMAWPNMWGNLGAALTPRLLPWINATFDRPHPWHASLIFLASAFFLSGIVAFGIRADVKLK